jgi:hypothetical protein
MSDPPQLDAWVAVWEFQVKLESFAEFERIYGPDGLWSKLFRQSSAYLGTELLRDTERTGRYLTIDRWISPEALHQFKQQHAEEYAALDKTCERLTASEAIVGKFESITAEQAGPTGGDSKSPPKDLSTNRRHFEGFGKSK